jgi:hypothetical protein
MWNESQNTHRLQLRLKATDYTLAVILNSTIRETSPFLCSDCVAVLAARTQTALASS